MQKNGVIKKEWVVIENADAIIAEYFLIKQK